MIDFEFENFIEFVNYTKRFRETGPRRYLRDFSNPFEVYSVREFYSRYRFTPNAVKNTLLPLLEPYLRQTSRRGLPFPPVVMVLLTLRFFATGSFQKFNGDAINVCYQSVSRIVCKVSTVIARKMKSFVKFPSTHEDINTVKLKFFEIGNFLEVIGCIGCTHIKIKSPGGVSSEVYKNSQGWYSIKVQAVTGPNMEFYDIIAQWPGSTLDNVIYNSSDLKQRLEMGSVPGILLGDNGYPASNFLLTPFQAPDTIEQLNYNKSHTTTTCTMENAFSIWKRRFPSLQVGMALKVDTVITIIRACATLHNISIAINDNMEIEDGSMFNDNNVDVQPV